MSGQVFGIHEKAMGTEEGILPARTKTGIDMISVNLLLENESDPVVWRGPVIAGVVKQSPLDPPTGKVRGQPAAWRAPEADRRRRSRLRMEDPAFPVPEVNNLVNLNRTVASCIEYHAGAASETISLGILSWEKR